jgi:hypothetical protein
MRSGWHRLGGTGILAGVADELDRRLNNAAG